MIQYCRTSSEKELLQILALQQANLPSLLSSEEKETEGFVTVHHTLDILTKMHTQCPHIIAKDEGKLAGYALCMHPSFGDAIDVLKPMFREISKSKLRDTSFIVMGQICIAKEYRGSGIFRKLYAAMAANLASKFTYIITEVDKANKRSIQAHYAVGFQKLKSYQEDEKYWEVLHLPIEPYS